MSKRRSTETNWSKVPSASPKLKMLHLQEDDLDGLFHCPVKDCNHDGSVSQRGCRKHVKTKHGWFIYFDEKPQHVRNQEEKSPKKEVQPSQQDLYLHLNAKV